MISARTGNPSLDNSSIYTMFVPHWTTYFLITLTQSFRAFPNSVCNVIGGKRHTGTGTSGTSFELYSVYLLISLFCFNLKQISF